MTQSGRKRALFSSLSEAKSRNHNSGTRDTFPPSAQLIAVVGTLDL
jgi:hypothetical protein